MEKKTLIRHSLIVCIICLLTLTSVPSVLSNDEKPDLIIEHIYKVTVPRGGRLPWEQEFIYCRVRNIGDAPVREDERFEYHIIVEQLLFNKFPIRTLKNSTRGFFIWQGLEPGESHCLVLSNNLRFFLPGNFRFHITVNQNQIINETNYGNNYGVETFFGYRGWRTYRWILVAEPLIVFD